MFVFFESCYHLQSSKFSKTIVRCHFFPHGIESFTAVLKIVWNDGLVCGLYIYSILHL